MLVNVEQFKSINHFISTVNSRTVNKAFTNKDLASKSGNYAFTKTHSLAEAEELLQNGWGEPVQKIKEAIKKNVKSYGSQTKIRMKTDIVGFSPCVPRALQGLPDSMYNQVRIQQKTKTIKIVYEISVSGGVVADDLINAGINLLSAIQLLEDKKIKVKLDISMGTVAEEKKSTELNCLRINVKDFRNSIDIKKMTFIFAHPSMLRRIMFKYLETSTLLKSRYYVGGYGTPLSIYKSTDKISKTYEQKVLQKDEVKVTYDICRKGINQILENINIK